MQFKIGDKVKYIGYNKKLKGLDGVVIRECRILSTLCVIVKIPGRLEEHFPTKYLKLNQKNQQLLFPFMDKLRLSK